MMILSDRQEFLKSLRTHLEFNLWPHCNRDSFLPVSLRALIKCANGMEGDILGYWNPKQVKVGPRQDPTWKKPASEIVSDLKLVEFISVIKEEFYKKGPCSFCFDLDLELCTFCGGCSFCCESEWHCAECFFPGGELCLCEHNGSEKYLISVGD